MAVITKTPKVKAKGGHVAPLAQSMETAGQGFAVMRNLVNKAFEDRKGRISKEYDLRQILQELEQYDGFFEFMSCLPVSFHLVMSAEYAERPFSYQVYADDHQFAREWECGSSFRSVWYADLSECIFGACVHVLIWSQKITDIVVGHQNWKEARSYHEDLQERISGRRIEDPVPDSELLVLERELKF